jgi:uncharacterized protein (TIGR02145 family)
MKGRLLVLVFFSVISSLVVSGQKSDLTGVQIGGMTWMTRNLEETSFRNGDRIPQAQSDEEWQEAGFKKIPAWCYYNDDNDSGSTEIHNRGKLYNSFAVNDPRGLAPEGWHIPNELEWNLLVLLTELEGTGVTGLFSNEIWPTAKSEWNALGMKITPDGWRDVGCGGLNSDVTFWGSFPDSSETLTVGFYLDEESIGQINYGSTSWIMGHYVRCVMD